MADESSPHGRSWVLVADLSFGDVERAFRGWKGGPTDRLGWIGGEPVGARWTRGGSSVTYSANQAIGLRVIESAERPPDGLALMTPSDAARLSEADDQTTSLLGTTALGLIGGVDCLPRLQGLVASKEPLIAAAADVASRRVGLRCLADGAETLAERQRHRPDVSVLFESLRSIDTRRQILRWLLQHPPTDRATLLQVLRTGLRDPDWEVRWTAVIGVALFGAAELVDDLKRCALDDRIERSDRQILEALRSTVGGDLVGTAVEHAEAEHLRDCLAGSVRNFDRPFLLLRALRDPLPEVASDDSPSSDFCAVPSVLHWVGDPEVAGCPVRNVAVDSAFRIMRRPAEPVPTASIEEAASELSAAMRCSLRLPTVLELEMACRGPDGRRYPWGNGRWRRDESSQSPWGLDRPLDQPEWVRAADGTIAALGGKGTRSCAGPLTTPERAAVRLIDC